MILDGHVTLNHKILKTAAINVTDADQIRINGKPLPQKEESKLWRYHKPEGLVVSHKDPQGRPSVFDKLAQQLPRVVSIGRLDINTEGLLLLTNDGEIERLLELPSSGWIRRYRVRAYGKMDDAGLAKLGQGVEIEGVRYGPVEAKVESSPGRQCLDDGRHPRRQEPRGQENLRISRPAGEPPDPHQFRALPARRTEARRN